MDERNRSLFDFDDVQVAWKAVYIVSTKNRLNSRTSTPHAVPPNSPPAHHLLLLLLLGLFGRFRQKKTPRLARYVVIIRVVMTNFIRPDGVALSWLAVSS
jgi:hypothetical protein